MNYNVIAEKKTNVYLKQTHIHTDVSLKIKLYKLNFI